jgi:hypothetical protein
MNRNLRPLAALAVIAVIGAGCGGNDGNGGGNTSAADNQEKAVKFAECMRENGISEFPDPDASGQLTIDGVLNGSSIDPNSPTWNAAIDACKDLQPPGFTGGGERDAGQQDAALRFAQCVRENGVPDFPDPANGQPLIDTNRIPSAAATSHGMSILNAATQKCSSYSEALGIQGQ